MPDSTAAALPPDDDCPEPPCPICGPKPGHCPHCDCAASDARHAAIDAANAAADRAAAAAFAAALAAAAPAPEIC